MNEAYRRKRVEHVFRDGGVLDFLWLACRYPKHFDIFHRTEHFVSLIDHVAASNKVLYDKRGLVLKGTGYYARLARFREEDGVPVAKVHDYHLFNMLGGHNGRITLRALDGRLFEADGALFGCPYAIENLEEPVAVIDFDVFCALPFNPYAEAHAVRYTEKRLTITVGTGYATKVGNQYALIPPEQAEMFPYAVPAQFWVLYGYKIGFRTTLTINGRYAYFRLHGSTKDFIKAKTYEDFLFAINRLVYPRLSSYKSPDKFYTDLAVKALNGGDHG